MNLLTPNQTGVILFALSQKTKAGIGTPSNQGPKRPRIYVVFLCPSKIQTAFTCFNSVMVDCIGQTLKSLAGALAGSSNPMQSATQRLEPKGGGLSIQGETTMRNYAQNPAKSSQKSNLISLFILIKRTPQERRVICQNLTFTQASSLAKEIPGALIKFSRMAEVSK